LKEQASYGEPACNATDPIRATAPLAQQALSGPRVAPALYQDVQHHPGLIDRAPQPVLHPRDRQHDLVQVLLAADGGQPAADLGCEALAELAPLR